MFSIGEKYVMLEMTEFVSDPSRGLCFQSTDSQKRSGNGTFVSVPSRGLCFQSEILGFAEWANAQNGFRPLSGIMFSISIFLIRIYNDIICFRPLSGIMFSIDTRRRLYDRKGNCFRPLSGIMFSIPHITNILFLLFMFPSPLGDYVFNL